MKIALLGDTHFDVSNSNEIVYQQQIKFFKEQFFPYLKENNIKHIIQFGDFMDNKTKVGTFIQYHLMKDFFNVLEDDGIIMYYFVGNHDLYNKDSREIFSLAVFEKAYKGVFKVFKSMDFQKFGSKNLMFVPWMYEHELPKMMDLISQHKPDKILGHFEIQDFCMSKDFPNTHGLNKDVFKDIPVWSGHFHLKQETNNIFYIGTPYQTSWTDFNESKGFYIYNTEEDTLDFIENTVTSKHLQIEIDSEEKKMFVEGFSTGVLEADLKKSIDYTIFKNHNVKIFIQKDNAFTKKVIEQIIEQCNKYKVKMSCIESEDGTETTIQETVDYHEFDITGSIKDRLETEFQISTFNKVHEETLKQIEE